MPATAPSPQYGGFDLAIGRHGNRQDLHLANHRGCVQRLRQGRYAVGHPSEHCGQLPRGPESQHATRSTNLGRGHVVASGVSGGGSVWRQASTIRDHTETAGTHLARHLRRAGCRQIVLGLGSGTGAVACRTPLGARNGWRVILGRCLAPKYVEISLSTTRTNLRS